LENESQLENQLTQVHFDEAIEMVSVFVWSMFRVVSNTDLTSCCSVLLPNLPFTL